MSVPVPVDVRVPPLVYVIVGLSHGGVVAGIVIVVGTVQ